jgi:hypothetical protein
MATLALSLAGQVVGGAIGGPIGATIGRALGALAGNAIDQMLFAGGDTPALADIRVQGSSQGVPIPKLYGWSRLSGNIIWASDLEEISAEDSGAKGTGGETGLAANFAVGFCEGEVARLGRIWADGNLLDMDDITIRFYRGTESQAADSLIEAIQGAEDAPAYRGLCYIVFERLNLKPFGNRIPNISVELCRVVGDLEPMISQVTVIPAATEFGYDPVARVRLVSRGVTEAENTHVAAGVSDWTLSIDELVALCPNLTRVSLVVAWYGDDLRCGSCTVRPKVEAASRTIRGASWVVSGIARGVAQVVSSHDGAPAYGGTPSDAAVLAAIADLKARGIAVTLYPMVLMDVPEGNTLPNPYGGTGQPAYPWRGRISCTPAPGVAGTVDRTATAATQASTFLGSAAVGQFSAGTGTVNFSGGADWGYRRMVLHYAKLAVMAGGVDALLIGSEMVGLTRVRGTANSFPFVSGLVTLAADVRAIVGAGTRISYAADWSEYSGHQPGGGAKFFHLDPLWASANIDAVGIDNYMPLADWRDGADGPDAAAWGGPYDADYLAANIAGGEGYDWYYASDADRRAGARTAITDGACGEPWVWRFKDIASWWGTAHHDRPGGVRSPAATAWVPGSKPVWFTELGCGAVDKGANQPNVFADPKSAESGLPYFSNGVPDALAQRQALRAVLDYWADPANNVAAPAYGGQMVERIALWTWDARPYPAFPSQLDVWSDGANYATGHWLTGRLGGMASDELIRTIGDDFGVTFDTVEAQAPMILGYVVDRPSTARDALQPVLEATGLEISDSPEGLRVRRPTVRNRLAITEVVDGEGPLVTRRRPDPGEAVGQVALAYIERQRDYLSGSVTAIGPEPGALEASASRLVLDTDSARAVAELALRRRTAPRDSLTLTLPPSQMVLEPGDAIVLDGVVYAVTELRDADATRVTAIEVPPSISVATMAQPVVPVSAPSASAEPAVDGAHLPPAADAPTQSRLALAALARPWPGDLTVVEDATGANVARLTGTATLGELTSPLAVGGAYCWDVRNAVEVEFYSGHLSSVDDDLVLAGANRIAIEADDGAWEVIGFADADLIAPRRYRLTRLLRGQWGTDAAIGPASSGNRAVLLDGAPTMLPVPIAWLGGDVDLRVFAGPSDGVGQVVPVDFGLDPVLPLAPVHLKAVRAVGGDVALSWVRRSRADGDSWIPDDAPLDYAPEAYRVTIFNGLTAVRSIDVTTPAAAYPAAQQTADFGSLPSSFGFTVAQKSPLFGAGHATSGTFNV